MSPPPQSQLTVLTYAETTTPTTMFTPPTIIALVLLAVLTVLLLGALLVFIFKRPRRQPVTEAQDDNFLDLEAGGKKSPFFEVVDGSAPSSSSAWTGVAGLSGSRPRDAGPEQPWPVHTVPSQPRPRVPSYRRMLSALVFWRNKSKCEPSRAADITWSKEVLDVQSLAHRGSSPWTWRNVFSLFTRKLPDIVIHPSDGSPPFLFVEDLDSTPETLRARRLLEQCEAVAFAAVDPDFGVASSEPQDGAPSSFMVLSESSASSFEESDSPHCATLMRPSTPLGMAPADDSAKSFVVVPIVEVVSRFGTDDIRPTVLVASSSASVGNAALEDDQSTPSNSSSESSVADIISILEEISADSSASSDSLSLRTSFSDDSMALQPSRKRFSGVFDTIKRVSLQLSDVDLNSDGTFSRSTYYGVLGDYHVRRVRDSIASGDTV